MTLFVDDADFRLYVGDVRDCLRDLPDESVHCVVTSPPYWGLRDYGTGSWVGGDPDCDHVKPTTTYNQGFNERWGQGGGQLKQEKKSEGQFAQACGKCGATRVDQQIGLEATPELFVQAMVAVFREVRRVLRADGTCWVNLGDSYASSTGGTHRPGEGLVSGRGANRDGCPVPDGLKPKDLCGIPWKVAFALQADGWYLRSDIVWSKPNPMPESVTDRPTKAHEYVFLLTRSPRYFFDQEAVREAAEWARWGAQNGAGKYAGEKSAAAMVQHRTKMELQKKAEGSGRNIRSVWEIATQPYPEAHFATFPEALPERCIKAGTSERGCCPVCGAPWEREVAKSYEGTFRESTGANAAGPYASQDGAPRLYAKNNGTAKPVPSIATTGWRPSCNHALEPVPCTVLDPFMGSGTTALVARRLGRRSIGVELNPEYAALCARRLQQLSLFGASA